MTTAARTWRFGLVLGGGALRGLAHIGALRALEERGWVPEETMGTSMGALVAAAWCSGFGIGDLESIALQLRRRDIFQIAHTDMALKRMQSPALYKSAPLRDLVRGLLGDVTFRELPRRLIVTSVEINSGQQMFWGLPGLDDVPVADAVLASCSLPGYFAPHYIRGRWWVDGALVDNLPVRFAARRGWDAVVGVDVGASSVLRADTQEAGFAAVFARATEIVLQQSNECHLRGWDARPLLLVRPRVEHVPLLSFRHARELMAEGYRATAHDLAESGAAWRTARSGVFPLRRVELRVMRERCVRCGACAALAPELFSMGSDGFAVARAGPVEWSPVDGAVLRHCPTYAIMARPAPAAAASTGGASTGTVRERS